jgi:hypothetical protein
VRCRSEGRKEEEGVELTGVKKSGEGALELDGGEVPVTNGGEEVVDAMQTATAVSNSWSVTACASRGKDEWRLETTAGSMVSGVLEYCERRRGRGISRRARERGEGERVRGERGELHHVRIDDVWRQKARTLAMKSSSLAARNREEGGRERRGGRAGLIGEVLMAMYSRENNGGVTPSTVSKTERGRGDCGEEEDDRRGPGVGEREEGCAGWTGSGVTGPVGPQARPKWSDVLFFFIFFLLFSFSFVSEFCFGFLKMLSKSDLNKIKSNHFCTLKSMF